MESFGLYLIKSASWLTGFALVYLLFLRNERFFVLKRIYLVAGTIVSFVFPFITIHYQIEVPAPVQAGFADAVNTGMVPDNTVYSGYSSTADSGNQRILLMVYLAGITIMIARTIRHLIPLIRSISRSEVSTKGKLRLVKSPWINSSFSFFNFIFLGTTICEKEAEHILNHEKVHVEEKHWFDLLLADLLRTVQWINPFAWLYNGMIKQNLEHLADRKAIEASGDPVLYRAALINQMFRAPVFNLASSFSYSVNRRRFEMMKTIITSPYRKLKFLFVLPVFAGILFAFALPEYNYVNPPGSTEQGDLIIAAAPAFQQNDVTGIILNDSGMPLAGASVTSTGTTGFARNDVTETNGWFSLQNVQADASLLIFCRGYQQLTLKPVFNASMTIRMARDPSYKPETAQMSERKLPLVAVDGVLTDKDMNTTRKELAYNFGMMRLLSGPAAVEKYGDRAAGGVYEITTRSKALEMGQNPPMVRLVPDDYPTFQGMRFVDFAAWVRKNVTYPKEATENNIEGFVQVAFRIEPDGSVTDVKAMVGAPQALANEVIRVISSASRWDPPVNKTITDAFQMSVDVGFRLPDKIEGVAPFVVVEEMPMFPGGDVELLRYIAENTQYPPEAKANRIEGRVIVRFAISTEGDVGYISVLKGVDPQLDAEAIRVVSTLKGFRPGRQGGVAVPVWYMVPITFTLN